MAASQLLSIDSIIPQSQNSVKGEQQLAKDAEFWLPKVTRDHFTWLTDEGRQKVKLCKSLEEFWGLSTVHQDNILAAW